MPQRKVFVFKLTELNRIKKENSIVSTIGFGRHKGLSICTNQKSGDMYFFQQK